MLISQSLHTRGAWIESPYITHYRIVYIRRSTHVERGLKVWVKINLVEKLKSLHTRGAWIESAHQSLHNKNKICRSTHVERGLKANS